MEINAASDLRSLRERQWKPYPPEMITSSRTIYIISYWLDISQPSIASYGLWSPAGLAKVAYNHLQAMRIKNQVQHPASQTGRCQHAGRIHFQFPHTGAHSPLIGWDKLTADYKLRRRPDYRRGRFFCLLPVGVETVVPRISASRVVSSPVARQFRAPEGCGLTFWVILATSLLLCLRSLYS